MLTSRFPKMRQLAGRIAALFVLSSSGLAFGSTTWTVNTCVDDASIGDVQTHSGSLRFVAAHAVSDDVVDLASQLACSSITLQDGAISLDQHNITLTGPGMHELTIRGFFDRVIQHTGTGWLKINDLSIAYGFQGQNPSSYYGEGGCILSLGSVTLDHASVTSCHSSGPGGGAFVRGALWLLDSTVSGNMATTEDIYHPSVGGGAYARLSILAQNSTISGNKADSEGGGLFAFLQPASIYYSTISENESAAAGGGIFAFYGAVIASSTISGNYANRSGAIDTYRSLTLANSTISKNSAVVQPGVVLRPYQDMTVSLESSLISGNRYSQTNVENDLDRCCANANAAVTFEGAKNIVSTPNIGLAPAIAEVGVCPLLGLLRNNGGPTKTHALLSKSPGIDAGDPGTASFDQRGFWRISGQTSDVGAYEIDQDDAIFSSGFDGCG